jgi:predicted membrane protein
MKNNLTGRPTSKLVIGLVVVAVGVLFTLDNLGIIVDDDYLKYWPILVIGLGLTKLTQPGRRAAGLFFMAIGSLLLLANLHLLDVFVLYFWPVLLIVVGANLVWRALLRQQGPQGEDIQSGDTITAIAFMAGITRNCNSQNFRGGEMIAVMGACEIDLTQASIDTFDGDAVINTLAFWGGIEIKVPLDWSVISNGVPVMGGFEDSTKPPEGGPQKRLVLNGFAMMGGVEVKN